jgi:hypothetical protein
MVSPMLTGRGPMNGLDDCASLASGQLWDWSIMAVARATPAWWTRPSRRDWRSTRRRSRHGIRGLVHDENYGRYPAQVQGGNGQDTSADIEAVRVRAAGLAGAHALLQETWDRYHLPLAVTEVHLGCTREEQLRWFVEVWDTASRLQREGCDIRAVTAWSLLGAYDWHTLVTRLEGIYEPGVFDLRAPSPRPTALVRLLRDLAAGRKPDHPLLTMPGWWRRPERLIYGWTVDAADEPRTARRIPAVSRSSVPPLLIIGAPTELSRTFEHLCDSARHSLPAGMEQSGLPRRGHSGGGDRQAQAVGSREPGRCSFRPGAGLGASRLVSPVSRRWSIGPCICFGSVLGADVRLFCPNRFRQYIVYALWRGRRARVTDGVESNGWRRFTHQPAGSGAYLP